MKIAPKTLLLFVAVPTIALNVHRSESGGTSKPAEYSPASAYIGVQKSVDEQAIMEAMTKSYALLARHAGVLRRSVNNDVDDKERRRDRIRRCKYFTADKDGIIKNLQRDIQVTAVPGTNLISVSMRWDKPIERASITNAVAEAIAAEANKRHETRIRRRIRVLSDRHNDLQKRKTALRKGIRDIRGASEVPLMTARSTLLQDSLAALAKELTSLRLQKTRVEAALDAFKEGEQKGELAKSPEIRSAVARDPSVAELRAAILQLKITALGDQANKQLPVIQKKLEAMLAARQKDAAREVIALKFSRLEAEYTSARERLLEVGNQYGEQSTRLRAVGALLQKIEEYESRIAGIDKQISEVETEMFRQVKTRVETPLSIQAYAE